MNKILLFIALVSLTFSQKTNPYADTKERCYAKNLSEKNLDPIKLEQDWTEWVITLDPTYCKGVEKTAIQFGRHACLPKNQQVRVYDTQPLPGFALFFKLVYNPKEKEGFTVFCPSEEGIDSAFRLFEETLVEDEYKEDEFIDGEREYFVVRKTNVKNKYMQKVLESLENPSFDFALGENAKGNGSCPESVYCLKDACKADLFWVEKYTIGTSDVSDVYLRVFGREISLKRKCYLAVKQDKGFIWAMTGLNSSCSGIYGFSESLPLDGNYVKESSRDQTRTQIPYCPGELEEDILKVWKFCMMLGHFTN